MEVKDLLQSLFKYLWLILVGTLVSFLFFFLSTQNLKQNYLGEATLLVMESKDQFSYNKLNSQKDVIFTIIYNRKFLQKVAKLNNDSPLDLTGSFGVSNQRNSKFISLSYTGSNKDTVLHTLQCIINSINPINEEIGLSSKKPLFIVIDEPSVSLVDVKKQRTDYVLINTLAVFFTLIAIILLMEYIKHERLSYVKK